LELYATIPGFKAAFYEKPIFSEADLTSDIIGNALYNIQIFNGKERGREGGKVELKLSKEEEYSQPFNFHPNSLPAF